jgi:hypothetical protein
VTARRDTIDGRAPTTDAGVYSICLSVSTTDGGPGVNLVMAWAEGRDAGMQTAPELSGSLLAFEVLW